MYYQKDCLPIEELAEKLWQLSELAYDFGSPWTKKQFETDLYQTTSRYLLYEKDDQWIGFIGYSLVLDEVDLTQVVVQKKMQHQGYGSQLITQLLHILREDEIEKVFLDVRVSNTSAKQLYEKKGFNVLYRRKEYYTNPLEDSFVMCLRVKEV